MTILQRNPSGLAKVSVGGGKDSAFPHPLQQLSCQETDKAREAVLKTLATSTAIEFRTIFLKEPNKAQLSPFLDAERHGKLSSNTPRPPRRARVQYDVVHSDRTREYVESVVALDTEEVVHRSLGKESIAFLTV